MVLFDILMQNFYKVTQGNHEKVPSFSTRLEETLYQIRLQCFRGVTDLEAQQHLKGCLFHGVHKHIRDSIRYLYSNSGATYSQLMIATCKVESENEEDNDKVGVQQQSPKGMDLGGPGPSRPQGMAQTLAVTGQRTAAEMATPVFLQ